MFGIPEWVREVTREIERSLEEQLGKLLASGEKNLLPQLNRLVQLIETLASKLDLQSEALRELRERIDRLERGGHDDDASASGGR